jgi:hypothetical protein
MSNDVVKEVLRNAFKQAAKSLTLQEIHAIMAMCLSELHIENIEEAKQETNLRGCINAMAHITDPEKHDITIENVDTRIFGISDEAEDMPAEFVKPIVKVDKEYDLSMDKFNKMAMFSDEADAKQLDDAQRYRDIKSTKEGY